MNKFQVECPSNILLNRKEFIAFLGNNADLGIKILVNPESVCLTRSGVYDILDTYKFNSVEITTFNPLEQHLEYNIIYKNSLLWFDHGTKNSYLVNNSLKQWNKSKVFMAMYGRPTADRLGIGSYLLERYPSDTVLTFNGKVDSEDNRKHFQLTELFTWDPPSLSRCNNLINQLSTKSADRSKYTNLGYDYSDILTNSYQDIFVDIVSETMYNGRSFVPSEKTVRPMLLKKPFIISGPCDFLTNLRRLGFKTFDQYWSEEYDGNDGASSYRKILQLIDTIGSKSKDELVDMYNSMKDILDHNHNMIVNMEWNKNATFVYLN